MSCRILLSRSSKNCVPAKGIENADRRAYSCDKSEIVGSRNSIYLLKNHKNDELRQQRLMSCQSS
ncbi:hypothetical protein, partial [Ignatzschineria indica]|uniref:hypothetical protein n=1 Tax=Ignatzschineria indica TaxID=472583 RepID=UPI001E639C07